MRLPQFGRSPSARSHYAQTDRQPLVVREHGWIEPSRSPGVLTVWSREAGASIAPLPKLLPIPKRSGIVGVVGTGKPRRRARRLVSRFQGAVSIDTDYAFGRSKTKPARP